MNLWGKIYVRKSWSFLGGFFRVNLSKKGLGFSVGVTGFRVGFSGAKGQWYVHAGRHAIYARHWFGKRANPALPARRKRERARRRTARALPASGA